MTPASLPAVPARAIAFLSVAAFASAATLRVTDPLLPQIAADFGVTTGAAGRVITAYAASYGLLQILFGPLAERVGKYVLVAFMTLASALSTFACAFATSLDTLTLARFASGATVGPLIPISLAFIGDAVPYAVRQPVLGRFLSGQILGVLFGTAAGGVIGELLGWRTAFVVLAGIFLVAGVCLLVEWRRSALTRGMARGGAEASAGYFGGIARVLARPWARVVLLTTILEGVFLYGPFAFVAAYLHQAGGVSLAVAGGIVAFFGLGGIIYALSVGPLVSRLGERGLVGMGGLFLFLAYGALAFVPGAWVAVPLMILLGLGFYMFHNTVQTNGTQMAPEARGVGMALFATCFFTGQSLGVALTAQLFDRVGAQAAFVAAALALGLLAAWFRRRLAARPLRAADGASHG
jgi:predicted MFS family arabinose efflux permease